MLKQFDTGYISLCSKELEICVNQAGELFSYIASSINLDSHWKEENKWGNEIKKSFVRGILRYSAASHILSNSILKLLSSSETGISKLKYYTLLYPIIHLAEDQSESGPFHSDQMGTKKQIRTVWVPITDYRYKGLSYLRQGKVGYKILKMFGKPADSIDRNKAYSKYLIGDVKINAGCLHSWTGGFFHKGNINSSGSPQCALVMRMSEEPMIYEPQGEIISNKNADFSFQELSCQSDRSLLSEKLLIQLELYEKICKFAHTIKSKNLNKEQMFAECHSYVENNKDEISKSVSFSLSIMAQRYVVSDKCLSEIIDLLSLFSGGENLISLKRIIKDQDNPDFISKYKDKKIDNMFEPETMFSSWQAARIMGERKNIKNAVKLFTT